ncbi:16S rRNA (cytosine(967)-C(5))-methyltransferase RsmB [Massilia scottii]|uniref:16S rRNA (cytosine(967)-C(5))-methyltransferase RsmB n=1 Tax=Massilia scottii TaxID=3057166 RepID=UPI0027965198|nr:16S rRNA (cytosine(967)-C(5))-methyltransferase RsmB [Massilia sp. CCM 9029]MDQ1832813.1 16S rRNA (cytosine(967)-C(5))-methyltransferase RsmB [Massilia sp. CCM 9029]
MTNKRPTLSIKPAAAKADKPAAPRMRASFEVKPVLQPGYRPDLKPDSLALCLLGAANAVAQVRGGAALPQALLTAFGVTAAAPQARGAIQDIAYRTMRQLGRSETLLGLMTSKAPEPPMLASLLCCALTLIDTPDGAEPPYEVFTVVDQAVTVASSHPDMAHAKGMVNAVLRRFLREREELLKTALMQPVAQWNYPQWWIDAAKAAYPANWQAILAAGNAQPPLTLRVNVRKTTVEAYIQLLADAGMAAAQIGPSAVRLEKALGVALIPGFDDGLASVQDAGAQLAAPLLDVQDGMRVLDACAAPGGKTCHLLELAQLDLTALDSDPRRLERVGENLERLGLSATLKAFEAQTSVWWDGQQFDRILADVPCTASGIVRRHPDIRWLRRKGDALQLATLSAKILDNLWQMLRPNGKLLFVTCSLWPQESEAQAAAFAVRHNATRLAAPGQLLPTGTAVQDHDGLFYALFQKNAT